MEEEVLSIKYYIKYNKYFYNNIDIEDEYIPPLAL